MRRRVYSVYIKNKLENIATLIDEGDMPVRIDFYDQNKALDFSEILADFGLNPVIWIQSEDDNDD